MEGGCGDKPIADAHRVSHACRVHEAAGSVAGTVAGSVAVEGLPTSEIAHVCEHLAVKALGMLLIYEELVVEIQARVRNDPRFDSLIALFGQWALLAGGGAGWGCFC